VITSDTVAGALQQALAARGLSPLNITVGTIADRASWRVTLDASATDGDRQIVAEVIAALDIAALDRQMSEAEAASAIHTRELQTTIAYILTLTRGVEPSAAAMDAALATWAAIYISLPESR
jgi:hypothetical protein